MEAAISKLVEVEQVVAMNNFGQIVVSVSSQKPFEIKQKNRNDLAENMAQVALKMHPDSSAILIAFGRTQPEIEQIGYAWENKSGTLVPIKQ